MMVPKTLMRHMFRRYNSFQQQSSKEYIFTIIFCTYEPNEQGSGVFMNASRGEVFGVEEVGWESITLGKDVVRSRN